MLKIIQNFIKLCDQHAGFLAFIAIVVAIILGIDFKNLDLSLPTNFVNKIWLILNYRVELPLFSLGLTVIVGFILAKRLKKRYTKRLVNIDFLVGTWENKWKGKDHSGSEICEIKQGGKYYIMNEHWFDIQNFKYDPKNNKISFMKVAVQPGDTRKVFNDLRVVNNDLIIGEEDGHEIHYTRISTT